MMRLVISPSRRYHLGREQQGFHNAIISTSTTQSKINWTLTWSLDKQLRKRNNEHEHKLPPSSSLPSSSPFYCSSASTTTWSRAAKEKNILVPSFPHYYPNSSFSSSPMLPLHHILLSRRKVTSSTTPISTTTPLLSVTAQKTGASQIQTKSSLSPSSFQRSFKLARILGGNEHRRFQGKMNILNRRLHSSLSSSSSHACTSSLFSISSSSSSPRFISTSSTHSFAVPTAAGENSKDFFTISPEVRSALQENVPVVALESAIITHGMPFPDNIDTAFRLESIIREHGAVPATVGVIRGRVTVGLTSNEIESLGEWANRKSNAAVRDRLLENPVVKVSRRDVPFVIAHKLSGGTTVSGTIIAAVKAGIPVFATGGLGGVHRGAESTFDISADLKELGRNPIGVVSAGVKSILDIGKTLEYMETEGICVAVLQKENTQGEHNRGGGGASEAENCKTAGAVHGQIGTAKFPSFFTSESTFTAPYSVKSEMEAASLIHSALEFQLNSAVLIAVPIPKEAEATTGKVIEDAIRMALEAAEKNSIQGKDMTPFLLGEVNRLTGGLSLKANKHLIENNVRSACGIATHLAQLRREQQQQRTERKSLEYTSLHSSFHDGSNGSSGPSKTSACYSDASGGGGSGDGSGIGQSVSPENYQRQHELKDIIHNSNVLSRPDGDRRGSIMIETVGYASGSTTTLENEVAEKNSIETIVGSSSSSSIDPNQENRNRHKRPVIIGGTSLDLVLAIQENEIVKDGRTHQAKITTAPGGVARNMCEALQKLHHDPIFLSAIGDDLFGRELLLQFEKMKIDHSKIMLSKDTSTAIYSALLNNSGECLFGMGDMVIHDKIGSDYILQNTTLIESAPIVVLDANIPLDTISTILEICSSSNTPVWFEPTEIRKSQKICMTPPDYRQVVSYMSPNIHELQSILKAAHKTSSRAPLDNCTRKWTFKARGTPGHSHPQENLIELDALTECFHIFSALEMVMLTKGKNGILIAFKDESSGYLESICYPAPKLSPDVIVSVSGAGDCLNAGFISSILKNCPWIDCARIGSECAAQSLKSHKNVPDAFFSV